MSMTDPKYQQSKLIVGVAMDKIRFHKGDGDMWPVTWANDGNLYCAAGDNMASPMNFWRVVGYPPPITWSYLELVDNLPVDPSIYCNMPGGDSKFGIKPASLLCVDGILYFAVEGTGNNADPSFRQQRNLHSWIITTTDFGKTWERDATPVDYFTGRLASPHFVQFGKDYEGARDEFVYAYFPATCDGGSSWENGDYILLGRVMKNHILERSEWKFYAGMSGCGEPLWNHGDVYAVPVFEYPRMTGENHVSFNKGLKRYIMGNYGFMDENGIPRTYHQDWPHSVYPSQLTLFEAPEPWGPWSLFYRDDNWGTYGDYQPCFPTKWMSEDGRTMWMVSSGTFDDYNFTLQKLTLEVDNPEECIS